VTTLKTYKLREKLQADPIYRPKTLVDHTLTAILCLGSHLPCRGSLNAEFAKLNSKATARIPDNVIQPSHENARRAEATLHADSLQLASGPRTVWKQNSRFVC
jgi:hypothetical protein